MYPDFVYKTPLYINALRTADPPTSNYLVIEAIVGGKKVRCLIDSGAQPSVIKQSCVPIGTEIHRREITIRGVQGPNIGVLGLAQILIEVGNCFLKQDCLVIEDDSIIFPENTEIILGANFLAINEVDISTSRWCLLKDGKPLQRLQPSWVDGR